MYRMQVEGVSLHPQTSAEEKRRELRVVEKKRLLCPHDGHEAQSCRSASVATHAMENDLIGITVPWASPPDPVISRYLNSALGLRWTGHRL